MGVTNTMALWTQCTPECNRAQVQQSLYSVLGCALLPCPWARRAEGAFGYNRAYKCSSVLGFSLLLRCTCSNARGFTRAASQVRRGGRSYLVCLFSCAPSSRVLGRFLLCRTHAHTHTPSKEKNAKSSNHKKVVPQTGSIGMKKSV